MSKLNELIAEKVMGWHLNPHYGDKQHYPYQMYERPNMDAIPTHEFQPATRLDDALLCLERAAKGAAWGSRLGKTDIYWVYINSDGPMYEANHEKLTIAMCLCSLRASGVPESLITQAME